MSPWPHRLAVALACATFPLIWVGGLVTTYDAGMAVSDWPTTYGYNLFLYPWQTWLFGPWNLFIEHGHRLLAALVGMLSIVVAFAVVAADRRSPVKLLAAAAVGAVVFQGVLGGMRVRLDARLLAQIHACVGPAFFAITVALAAVTSRRWLAAGTPIPGARGVGMLALAATAMAYMQLMLGSQLRHMPPHAGPSIFQTAVVLHLSGAAALAVEVGWLWLRVRRLAAGEPWITRPANLLAAFMLAQLALGGAAWVVNYGWPSWFDGYGWTEGFVVTRESASQALTTTAHVALGSLVLVTALAVALRSLRMSAREELAIAGRLVQEAVA